MLDAVEAAEKPPDFVGAEYDGASRSADAASIYFADAPLATDLRRPAMAGSHGRSGRRSVPGPRG
jgi:hypothetical protein